MFKIKQAFIFAAGRGERMRPLTDSIPKPLIKVKNKPILDYLIEKLDKIDEIEKIVINGYYLAEKIESYIENLQNDKISFSKEVTKLETGGGLLYAMKNEKFDPSQPILLLNGDIIFDGDEMNLDIKKLKNIFEKHDLDIVLGLTKTKDYFGYRGKGDFNLEKNGNLTKSSDNLEYSFTGLQIINPRILEKAETEYFSMSYFYSNFEKLGIKMKGVELNSKFYHIGDVKSLEEIESVL